MKGRLNPGIVRTVAWLTANGFRTCDSGDGQTHDYDCDREYPYVCMIAERDTLLSDTDRLAALLRAAGIRFDPSGEAGVTVCATYDPTQSPDGIIEITGLKDSMLPVPA